MKTPRPTLKTPTLYPPEFPQLGTLPLPSSTSPKCPKNLMEDTLRKPYLKGPLGLNSELM